MGLDVGKSLILVVTTLSVFGLLVANMPYYIIEDYGSERQKANTPEIWRFGYFMGLNATCETKQIQRYQKNFLIVGDRHIHISWLPSAISPDAIYLYHQYETGIGFPPFTHDITPEDKEDVWIDLQFILDHQPTGQNFSFFTASCECPLIYEVFIGFDNETYEDFQEAWDTGILNVTICLPTHDAYLEPNAIQIVMSILFFQAPDIHPMINVLIAIPLWLCVAWIAVWVLGYLKPF